MVITSNTEEEEIDRRAGNCGLSSNDIAYVSYVRHQVHLRLEENFRLASNDILLTFSRQDLCFTDSGKELSVI